MNKGKQKLGLLAASIISVSLLSASSAMAADKVIVVPLNISGKAGVGTVTTTVGGSAWLPHNLSPQTVERYITNTTVSGDGLMVLGVSAPASFDGVAYGLESAEICVRVTGSGYVDKIQIYRTDTATSYTLMIEDETDRTADGCYTYLVGGSVNKGIGIALWLSGGGEVRIEGTTFTWTESAAVPGVVKSTATMTENSNNM